MKHHCPYPSATASAACAPCLDLDAELADALAHVRPQHVERLAALGVARFIARPLLVGVARVLFDGVYYQPHESGSPAVIVAVRGDRDDGSEIEHAAPIDAARRGEGLVDLIAFAPNAPDRFALRAGNAIVLGFMPPQYLSPEPVRFHRTPLDWLRAEADGVCILDDRPQVAAGILAHCRGGVIVADLEHGRQLSRISERPWPVPPIYVADRVGRTAS